MLAEIEAIVARTAAVSASRETKRRKPNQYSVEGAGQARIVSSVHSTIEGALEDMSRKRV